MYVRTCSYHFLIARYVSEKTRTCELECVCKTAVAVAEAAEATSKYYHMARTRDSYTTLTLSGKVVSFA